jgi:hypothetical protein
MYCSQEQVVCSSHLLISMGLDDLYLLFERDCFC